MKRFLFVFIIWWLVLWPSLLAGAEDVKANKRGMVLKLTKEISKIYLPGLYQQAERVEQEVKKYSQVSGSFEDKKGELIIDYGFAGKADFDYGGIEFKIKGELGSIRVVFEGEAGYGFRRGGDNEAFNCQTILRLEFLFP